MTKQNRRINRLTFMNRTSYSSLVENKIEIVKAEQTDVPIILDFIRQLAKYEKLEHEMKVTNEMLATYLFGETPVAEVIFAEVNSVKVGFALFFKSFSTFLGQPGIYLEDLFVLPEYRTRGYGKLLLAHLAHITIERGFGRLEWSVLDWNKPAIDLYLSLGSKPMTEWTVHRMTGEDLQKLSSFESAGALRLASRATPASIKSQ